MMQYELDMARFAYYGISTPEDEQESEQMQLDLLDYQQLTPEVRGNLKQRAERINERTRRMSQDAWENGREFYEAQQELAQHRHGIFQQWAEQETGYSIRTVYNLISVYQQFNYANFAQLDIATSALYLLAAPSTPEPARQEAIDRAQNGETITHTKAKEIVNGHKPTANGTDQTTTLEDTRPLFLGDPHLDAALEDESNPVCHECGQVYDGDTCPDCKPQNKMSQPMGVFMSHDSIEWYTPPKYIEAARQVMGAIDLDPATAQAPQEWIKATIFYTIADNGLVQPWQGRVWLNPPYSTTNGQSNQELWSIKLIEEYQAGRVDEAILLVKASLGYNWFDRLFDVYPVCFKRGLISFFSADGESGPAKLGSAFFYLGPNLAKFSTVFGQFGRVVLPEEAIYVG